MELRGDITRREVVLPDREAWPLSPSDHSARRLLDRVGAAVVRETAIERCAPGAPLAAARGHGQEILVLDGSLHDGAGDYPAGAYVRMPTSTEHPAYAGSAGALLFVKRSRFAAADRGRVVIPTRAARWHQGLVPGLTVLPLHACGSEQTALVRWAPATRFMRHHHRGGEEILVLDGVFRDEHGTYPQGTWIRSPHLSSHDPFTECEGAVIYVKTGHLPEP